MWKYYRNDPNDNIAESGSFTFTMKITEKTPAASNTKGVKIETTLQY